MIEEIYKWKEHNKKDVLSIVNILEQVKDKETLINYINLKEDVVNED